VQHESYSSDLFPDSVPPPAALIVASTRRHTAQSILDAWRAGKSPNTMRSYEHDLDVFAGFLSNGLGITPALSTERALDRLFREDSASAHGIVLQFRASLLAANLAPASINRALATLRSVSKLARMLGVVHGGWYLEVPGVKAERRRDTRGPAVEDIRRMLEATAGRHGDGNSRRGDRRDALLPRAARVGAVRVEPRGDGSRARDDLDPRQGTARA
jgi:hypothetical protein